MDWDKLRVFHAVAEAGSFTHAGEVLHLSQSAVSRQISGLEENLSVPLFHRHARGLILTEQGDLLLKATRDVFDRLSGVERALRESKEVPKGPLKISTTIAFGSAWLTPRIDDFLRRYPDISVSLLLGDRDFDLSMREADVAIRVVPPKQPDLIRRHLFNFTFGCFASEEYIAERGMPEHVEELKNHRLIAYAEGLNKPPFPDVNWMLEAAGNPDPSFAVNNFYAIYRAVQAGAGIAALPDYMMVAEDTMLRRVLPDLAGPTVSAYFVYPEELRHSKRIAVLRDFLLEQVKSGAI